MGPTKRFRNTSNKAVQFTIWGNANMPPTKYNVEPGGECDVPAGYAGNFMKRRAPGMTAVEDLPTEEPTPPAPPAPPEPEPEEEPTPEPASPLAGFGKKKGKRGR